ncbi:LysR family transcriptional regulator [Streptomyces sp. NA04227]|uniref:LysR substrate-binding domain-containing protein n=1 Tax=Streptomyces sp. NA04227 TaxID=2742136 RepID=UPI0015910FE8|nr:LysR family transcriptional regulator [Streptomyces sp. NA04227]QKW09748.1 LysR family transcriptional regulator [Streptomyces sp. NA04227]
MRLDVRHLELVLAIQESGSLRSAAARLHLTQPAVTAQLQRIENHLGGELFVRAPQGVVPTRAGTQFLRRARQVLDDIEGLTRSVRTTLSHEADSPVRVGGVPAQQFGLLLQALSEMCPQRGVTSRTVKSTAMLTALLASGELDVAVMRRFPGFPLDLPPGLSHRVLLTEPIFTGVSQGHALASAGRGEGESPAGISLAALAEEDWVMPHPDDSGMNDYFARTCERAGFTQRVRHLTDASHIAFTLTAAGDAVCPLYPLGGERPGITMLTLAGNPLFREVVLAWRTDGVVAPLVDELCGRVAHGYLALVRTSPVYRQWWDEGGAEFSVP